MARRPYTAHLWLDPEVPSICGYLYDSSPSAGGDSLVIYVYVGMTYKSKDKVKDLLHTYGMTLVTLVCTSCHVNNNCLM